MRAAILSLLVFVLVGCGASFELAVPEGLVALPHSDRHGYELRAGSPDGVVLGVQHVDNTDSANVAFWRRAVLVTVQDQLGHELVQEEAVRAASGQDGLLLRFRRDIQGTEHVYWLALFVSPDDIHLVEAGGPASYFGELEGAIRASIAGLRIH